MATHAVSGEERSFSIGTVLSRAFGTLGDNPVATFGIAFLLGAVPQALYSYFIGSTLAMADRSSTIATIAVSIGSFVIFLLLSMLVQGALVRATIAHIDGQRASFADCIGAGLTAAVPLIGLTILLILGIMAGFMLLVVPGIILFLMWSVAAPALVAEGSGVFAAFSRSRYLTKGARWKIFGLQILLLVLMWLLTAVLGIIMVAGDMMPAVQGGTIALSPTYLAVSAVINTLIIALWSTTQASLYGALRQWKDGPQAQDLAHIFG
ncbi:hypothetical protein Q4610_12855 [Sphingobium sp. HBC34]|uniref:DUF7847 domain-containing protein n=1 Tax=Sphingobium cyanobacteriorum TaxID=3063954 RepID=A0ABT8ZN94_9SPHN|nr:hypothetical protein [Sphingobium sp. HBC34]MDO7835936.1 hypothetical protein [Sphingobium sp. HBC34]